MYEQYNYYHKFWKGRIHWLSISIHVIDWYKVSQREKQSKYFYLKYDINT